MSNSLGEALKSALAKQWASDDEAHNKMEGKGKKLFAPTNNVTRATFNEIRDYPAKRIAILNRLKADGFNKNSVSSLITQMIRQGMVTVGSDGRLHTTIAEYAPLRPWRHTAPSKPKIVIKKKEAKPMVETKEEQPVREEKPVREERRPVSNTLFLGWSTREILENLDIFQARAVYDELKQIFGDAK